jgi:FkbM family methyltransferase
VLELGAHTGGDTQEFLDEFLGIRIYCFEPDPRCIKGFKRYVKDQRCILFEGAVSNKDDYAILTMSSGWPDMPSFFRVFGLSRLFCLFSRKAWNLSSSIKETISNPVDYPWLTFEKQKKVKTIRLDTWVKENEIHSIDFIWSDVQGAEMDVLEGAEETLKICRYFYTEYGEVSTYPEAMTREETIHFFLSMNYVLVPEYASDGKIGNLLFENKRWVETA